MKINTNNKEYKINFFFSPPIDQNLIISKKSKNCKKYREIYFKSQNTFYTYFDMILKIIKKKKFNFFYDELRQTAKIKNEII